MPATDTTSAARDLWTRLAPQPARNLINARNASQRQRDREQKVLAGLTLLYWFDADAMRYIRYDGRPVSPASVKQAVNAFADKVTNQLGAIGSRLGDKSIGLSEWQTAMAQKIDAAHTAVVAIANGGIDRTTDEDAEPLVRFHTDRLRAFADDLARGDKSPEMIVARSRLYGVSIPGTFEVAQHDAYGRLSSSTGVTVETFNVLDDAAHHCTPRGALVSCVEESDKGWVPMQLMTRPGERACGPGCRCRQKYRTALAAGESVPAKNN